METGQGPKRAIRKNERCNIMKNLQKAVQKIKKAGTVAIACHINPDGDAIGSQLALGEGLRQLGKKVYYVSRDGVPKKYKSLPEAQKVKRKLLCKADLAVTVDCSTKEMIGSPFRKMREAETFLEIDHHETRKPFGDISLVDPSAAAVGEIVYVLLKALGVRMTEGIAQNILTSLIVETNSFRLPSVTAVTFKVCESMMKTGVDFYKLVEAVYWSNTREMAVLSGICMARCRFEKKGRLIWSFIKRSDFKKIKGKDEDVDAVADNMRAITGVDIAVFFREKTKKRIRVSLRSKKGINVGEMAAIYGGGGHADVAGCRIPNTPEAIKSVVDTAEEFL